VEAAVAAARGAGKPIGEYLVDTSVITGDQLAEALAFRFGVDHVHLANFAVDMAAANLIAPDVAKRLDAVPVGFIGHATLVVAMRDPANVNAIDDIAMLTGYNVRPAVATRDDIHDLIARLNRFGAWRRSPTSRPTRSTPRSLPRRRPTRRSSRSSTRSSGRPSSSAPPTSTSSQPTAAAWTYECASTA
jgi:hypothetical protein